MSQEDFLLRAVITIVMLLTFLYIKNPCIPIRSKIKYFLRKLPPDFIVEQNENGYYRIVYPKTIEDELKNSLELMIGYTEPSKRYTEVLAEGWEKYHDFLSYKKMLEERELKNNNHWKYIKQ